MAGVVLDGISRVFSGRGRSAPVAAVQQVDLEVHDGEMLVLVGPSGCGKTTLLRLIAGLDHPTSGTITLGGRRIDLLAPKDRDVAMVFQSHALYPHLNVYQNLSFGMELRQGFRGWRRALRRFCGLKAGSRSENAESELDERVRSAARVLGIESLLSRMPRELSGGERQRVALGRAMVRRPAIFLLDEPLSNLDAQLRDELRRALKLWHEGTFSTAIHVTHDQSEALTLGTRVAVMNAGRLEQVAKPLELYDRPKNRFVASFIGSPPMNFLPGELAIIDDAIKFVLGSVTIPLDRLVASRVQRYIGRRVWLGVRPEDLHLSSHRPSGSLTGLVLSVESLGDHGVVHVQLSALAVTLAVKTVCRSMPLPGEVVPVEINVERAHVFDGDAGENVTWA